MVFDCFIASHYHEDHAKNLAGAGIEFKHWVDMGGYKVANADGDVDDFKSSMPVITLNENKTAKYISKYIDEIARQACRPVGAATRIPLCFLEKALTPERKYVEIRLDDAYDQVGGQKIRMMCIAGAGVISNMSDDPSVDTFNDFLRNEEIEKNKKRKKKVKRKPYSPNDSSLCFLIEWDIGGKLFKYLTCGDLSGIDNSSYNNMEIPLLEGMEKSGLIGDGLTAMKMNHHGSGNNNHWIEYTDGSSSSYFMSLKPTTIIATANECHDLPDSEGLDRVYRYSSSDCGKRRNTGFFVVNNCEFSSDIRSVSADRVGKMISGGVDTNLVETKLAYTGDDGEDVFSIENGGLSSVILSVSHTVDNLSHDILMAAKGAKRTKKAGDKKDKILDYNIIPISDKIHERGVGDGLVKHKVIVRKADILKICNEYDVGVYNLMRAMKANFKVLDVRKLESLKKHVAKESAEFAVSTPNLKDYPAFSQLVFDGSSSDVYYRFVMNLFFSFYAKDDSALTYILRSDFNRPDSWRTLQPILSRFDPEKAPLDPLPLVVPPVNASLMVGARDLAAKSELLKRKREEEEEEGEDEDGDSMDESE